MGVKSSITLTRQEAIDKGVDLLIETQRRKFEAMFVGMSNRELEDKLEEMNDAAHDGEGFENYIISEY